MIFEFIKLLIYSTIIVLTSKYILTTTLRKLAQSLNLKSKTRGNIAGVATSIPELLTITTSSIRGFQNASIYNILSSNTINLGQYISTLILNKNIKKLKNHAIITDMVLVLITIIIPIALLKLNIKLDIFIVPMFIILYLLFVFLNNNVHKLYLNDAIDDEKNNLSPKGNNRKIYAYIIILFITGIVLFYVGELLGNTLENLCNLFNVSQTIIGILLGLITSVPELMTFFEAQKYNKKIKNEMDGVVEATNNLFTSNILNLFVIQTIGILLLQLNG